MKLSFVEVAGFRGFKDQSRFDLLSGFAVLTGRNGAGKSTVLDAVDLALTGTITKFSVTGARGGGLNRTTRHWDTHVCRRRPNPPCPPLSKGGFVTQIMYTNLVGSDLADHIWWVGEETPKAYYVRIGFAGDDGEEFVITRSREHGVNRNDEEITRRLCIDAGTSSNWSETLMQTTLIRDETIAILSFDHPEQACFTAVRTVRAAIGGLAGHDYSARTAALTREANAIGSEQVKRVEGVQGELSQALGTLTEARSAAERSTDVAEAVQIISALEPQLIATASPPDALRRRLAERKRILPLLQEGVERAEHLLDEQHSFGATGDAELAWARESVKVRRRTFAQGTESLREAERLEALARESDDFAAHMSALLRHGEAVGLQDGHCPLCDAIRKSEDFATAIERARRRPADRGARVVHAVAAFTAVRSVVAHAKQELQTAQQLVLSLEQRHIALENGLQSVEAIFTEFHIDALPVNLDVASRQILQKREEAARLERAMLIIETSGAHDRVTALETRVGQLKSQVDVESARLVAAQRAIELAPHQARWPVAVMCAVMQVSRRGCYAYVRHQASIDGGAGEAALLVRVKTIAAEARQSYGSRRMAKPLQADGVAVGRYNARRLMRQAQVTVPRRQPRHPVTTDSRHGDTVAPNLLARQCAVAKPNQAWVGDITYGWTAEGWVSLGVLLDWSSRKVVGWAMRQRVDAALVQEALPRALGRRQPAAGVIHPSDRGRQDACGIYQALLAASGRRCRMSRKGDGLDHAVAERCFGRLTGERTSLRPYASRQEAWDDIIDYIEMFYNSQRFHAYLGYVSPNDFERLGRIA